VPESVAPISREKAERRQITVLFCDLVGSTQLARAMDPEDWHQLLNEIHSQFGEVVAEHHGHVAQYLGDGLLAYFGYPTAAQDDPRRAVTAGLALLRQAASIEAATHRNIRVRVGIHTGAVVVGHVGSRRQESLALGETPNLAARIQELAPPNSVVVSAETHRLVEGFFLSEVLGSLVPKGFSDPVSLYRVLEESGVTTRLEAASAAGLTPLVGRDVEARAIEQAWSLAEAGRGPTMLLLGDAGIGKSRLIHELKERLEPRRVSFLELRCSEHARNSAFHPLIEGLQRLAGVRPGESTEQITSKLDRLLRPLGLSEQQTALIRSLLGVPLPSSYVLPTQSLRAALVEAFSAWVAGTADSGPTLFIVEDLHWADPSTLELLSALVKRPSPRTVLTVFSARPEFQTEWTAEQHVQTLVPRRLDAHDTRRLITFVAGGEFLPKELVEQLATRADGIPLFLEEMTKAILESGLLRKTDDGYQLDQPIRNSTIPTTLHDSLMGRLDQLGPHKAIVQVASVLGKEFSLRLFESVWRRSPSPADIDVKTGLERVVAAQLISRSGQFESDTVYQFKHSLVQEAAYHSLLRSARRNYHLQTAGALRDEFTAQAELQPELVAYHYAAAQMDEQAADFWFKAGQRSIGSSAYLEAISQFSAALDHLGTLPRSAQRLRREIENRAALGVALLTTRGYAAREVHETFSLAALLCKELGAELPFRVLYGVWGVNLVRGDLTSVQHMVPTFKRVAQEEADSMSSLAAHAALGTWAFWRADYTGLREHYEAASRLLDANRAKAMHEQLVRDHGFEGLLYAHLYFAWSLAITGDGAGATRVLREAESLAERTGDPYVRATVLAFGAALNHDLGDIPRASELAERLRELAEEKGYLFWLAIALVIRGHGAGARDAPDAWIERVDEGLAMFRVAGAKTPYTYYSTYLAEVYIATGRAEEALGVLDAGLEAARTTVEGNYAPEILRLIGEARLTLGHVDAARSSLDASLALAREQGARLFELRTATSLARLLRRQGNDADARKLLGEVRGSFGPGTELSYLRDADQLIAELSLAAG
jgi:class 3 adenylate cyclase/tetratricopeptide (TPR) repeat protein